MWTQRKDCESSERAEGWRKVDLTQAGMASRPDRPSSVTSPYEAGKRISLEFVLIARTIGPTFLSPLPKTLRSPYTRISVHPSPTLSKVDRPHQRPLKRPRALFRSKGDQEADNQGRSPQKKPRFGGYRGSEEGRSGRGMLIVLAVRLIEDAFGRIDPGQPVRGVFFPVAMSFAFAMVGVVDGSGD